MPDAPIESLLPQLCMRLTIEPGSNIPISDLPVGYELRGYEPGDESKWADLINLGGFGQKFDADRVIEYMESPERLAGSSIVVKEGEILAATFATIQHESTNLSSLDYVVSHPDYRGLGLGRIVCEAVVNYFVEIGRNDVILHTDDWRLPALGLYLSMGFVPNLICATDIHLRPPDNPQDDDFVKSQKDILKRWDSVNQKLRERNG